MLNGRFVCTMRMPITLDMVTGYDGDKPMIDGVKVTKYIEEKRPSLRGKPYRIYLE